MTPYFEQDGITIYHGDCREVTEWLCADVLVSDPPYGIDWKQGVLNLSGSGGHAGIANDKDTVVRDAALALWGTDRPAVLFGSLSLAPPPGTKQVLIYHKPPDSGARGAMGGFRRDAEAIYLIGQWPSGIGGRSSVLATGARATGSRHGVAARGGHPHSKPLDVMATLIGATTGLIADPFMGAGSTLVAAKQMGRPAIGVELVEEYCETAAKRLSQGVLFPVSEVAL
jgi:site-specific DNA-methyltransferase (adenine-specific)